MKSQADKEELNRQQRMTEVAEKAQIALSLWQKKLRLSLKAPASALVGTFRGSERHEAGFKGGATHINYFVTTFLWEENGHWFAAYYREDELNTFVSKFDTEELKRRLEIFMQIATNTREARWTPLAELADIDRALDAEGQILERTAAQASARQTLRLSGAEPWWLPAQTDPARSAALDAINAWLLEHIGHAPTDGTLIIEGPTDNLVLIEWTVRGETGRHLYVSWNSQTEALDVAVEIVADFTRPTERTRFGLNSRDQFERALYYEESRIEERQRLA